MPAEAIGKKKAGCRFNRTKNAVVVGSHFIESGPCALGIDGKILKHRHTVSCMNENFLDERRFKVCLVARCLCGIIPSQQKAAAFRTEMEAGAHIDDHGRAVGEVEERL